MSLLFMTDSSFVQSGGWTWGFKVVSCWDRRGSREEKQKLTQIRASPSFTPRSLRSPTATRKGWEILPETFSGFFKNLFYFSFEF